MIKMHDELIKAINDRDHDKVCQFIHTNHFESDSDFTVMRCDLSFVEGFRYAEFLFRDRKDVRNLLAQKATMDKVNRHKLKD